MKEPTNQRPSAASLLPGTHAIPAHSPCKMAVEKLPGSQPLKPGERAVRGQKLWTSSMAAVLACAGCQSPPTLAPVTAQATTQQFALAEQMQTVENQHQLTDRYNQQLLGEIAQKDQQLSLLQSQLAGMKQELSGVNQQLAQTRQQHEQTEKKTAAVLASTQTRVGARITANNSLQQALPAFNLPGVEVRLTGETIRVDIASDQLFEPGSAQLKSGAATTIETVADQLRRNYPNQKIGIEGHTESSQEAAASPDAVLLSADQAAAVYRHLAARGHLSPAQTFLAAHGSSDPVVSNATEAGQARNRRVELVVYPE